MSLLAAKSKNIIFNKKTAFVLLVLAAVFIFLNRGLLTQTQDAKHPAFPIHMTIDFGTAGIQGYEDELIIEEGMSANQAAGLVYPIMYGMGCCSLKETLEINGVRIDPIQNRWWQVTINGSHKVSPYRTMLKKGDKVELRYIEDNQ